MATVQIGGKTYDFDESAYLQNKAATLNTATDLTYNPGNVQAGNWNEYNTLSAFSQAGLTPLEHFMQYGINEGISPVAEPPQIYEPDRYPESRQGLDQGYIDQIMTAIMPQFQSSIEGYSGNIDELVAQALGGSRGMSESALTGVMQNLTNELNLRGIMDSSITGDIMGNATGEVLKNYANQTYQTGMEGAKLQLGMPAMLGQLIGLGQTSTSTDTSVPQRILASIYTGSM